MSSRASSAIAFCASVDMVGTMNNALPTVIHLNGEPIGRIQRNADENGQIAGSDWIAVSYVRRAVGSGFRTADDATDYVRRLAA